MFVGNTMKNFVVAIIANTAAELHPPVGMWMNNFRSIFGSTCIKVLQKKKRKIIRQ